MSQLKQQNPVISDTFMMDIEGEVRQIFHDLVDGIGDFDNGGVITEEAISVCADRIEILALSCSQEHLLGLMDSCQLLQHELNYRIANDTLIDVDYVHNIIDWPCLVLSYLSNTQDTNVIDELINFHSRDCWATKKINSSEEQGLRALLLHDFDKTSVEELVNETTEASNILHSEDNISEVLPQVPSLIRPLTQVDDAKESVPVENNEDLTLSDDCKELISLVSMEIDASSSRIDSLLDIACSHDSSITSIKDALNEYSEELSKLSIAVESIGLEGLKIIFADIAQYLLTCSNKDLEQQNELYIYLREWPPLVSSCLNRINTTDARQSLVEYFISLPGGDEILSLSADDVKSLLINPDISSEEEDVEPRMTQATQADVSLELPEDVNQQLVETLLHELPTQTEELSGVISQISAGKADINDVAVANRIAHTLKGSANTVGVVGVATLTHHMEDILEAFTKENSVPSGDIALSLLNASDVLEMMSESLLGTGPEPSHAVEVLQSILDWANSIDQNGLPESVNSVSKLMDEEEVSSDKDATDNGVDNNQNITQDAQAASSVLRVPASVIDDLLRLVGESTILNGQLQERLRQARIHTEAVHEQNILFQNLTYELEQLVDIQGLSVHKTSIEDSLATPFHQGENFDALEMDQYNELHTITHRLVEASTDAKEMTQGIEDQLLAFDGLMVDQERLYRENQELVMRTRMVPVKNIISRLQRSVRQTCRQTDKTAELNIIGDDTLIDSDVLNDLVDPLMHIIRNSIDHGIETEEARIKHNKTSHGNINLIFKREGENIIVRCEDDGSGLDLNKIRARAIDSGLLTSESSVSDEEISRFILSPGFTTRSKTTQVSGRGIGMDVVYTRVKQMKGVVDVSNNSSGGCSVELRLPLTLISIHALLVSCNTQNIAISSRGIEQIIYSGAGTADYEAGQYHFNGQEYSLCDIESLAGLPSGLSKTDRDQRAILLVRTETNKLQAVSVEEVKSTQDLVLKQFNEYVPISQGVAGATILGDGSVAPVLELTELIRASERGEITFDDMSDDIVSATSDLPLAMVVDDSLSARRSLAEFISDSGYEVVTARDGLEAIELIQQRRPDILLVDMEMPRMNGLELTAHVRASQETENLPVIMITSRSTEKHKQQATSAGVNAYLIKPFSEMALIEHVEQALNSTIGD